MKKIAAIQMCSSEIVAQNLSDASQLIKRASLGGATLIILPEMFPIFGKTTTDKVKIKEKHGSGKIQKFLSDQAAQNNVWIVGGTIPLSSDTNDKIRAASLVYDNKGYNIGRYDKIHLFDAVISETESYRESDTTDPGNELVTVDTPVGKLGLSVCYDIRFPSLFTELQRMGAEIITIPAAFTMKTGIAHWNLLTRTRAVENFCYLVGSCQGGSHPNGRQTYGHSLIVDPWGNIIQEAIEPGNAIVYANINLERLYDLRAAYWN